MMSPTANTITTPVGTAANNLVQLNGSAQLPAVSGTLLTNIGPVLLGGGAVGSGASFAVTSIPASSVLYCVFESVNSASNGAYLDIALSNDNGSSYGSSIVVTGYPGAGT